MKMKLNEFNNDENRKIQMIFEILEQHSSYVTVNAWNKNPSLNAIKLSNLKPLNINASCPILKHPDFYTVMESRSSHVVLTINEHQSLITINVARMLKDVIKS